MAKMYYALCAEQSVIFIVHFDIFLHIFTLSLL